MGNHTPLAPQNINNGRFILWYRKSS